MDFMFEDEADEVGSDVEAYCPKCKGDTTHVVISKYEDEIRRVQCNPCGDVHSYRKPRGEVEDDVPEPIAAKKRAMMKKLTWEEFFAKHGHKEAKPYEFRERYSENAIVSHPKFGPGFVSEIVSDSKVEITFKDARRILVHNRKDMPGMPLAAEGDGLPSTAVPPPKPAKHKAEKAEKTDKTDKSAAPAKSGPAAKAPAPAKVAAAAKPAAPAKPVKLAPAAGKAPRQPAAKSDARVPAAKPRAAGAVPARKTARPAAKQSKPARKPAPAKKTAAKSKKK